MTVEYYAYQSLRFTPAAAQHRPTTLNSPILEPLVVAHDSEWVLRNLRDIITLSVCVWGVSRNPLEHAMHKWISGTEVDFDGQRALASRAAIHGAMRNSRVALIHTKGGRE